jgi:hypothetical protein
MLPNACFLSNGRASPRRKTAGSLPVSFFFTSPFFCTFQFSKFAHYFYFYFYFYFFFFFFFFADQIPPELLTQFDEAEISRGREKIEKILKKSFPALTSIPYYECCEHCDTRIFLSALETNDTAILKKFREKVFYVDSARRPLHNSFTLALLGNHFDIAKEFFK